MTTKGRRTQAVHGGTKRSQWGELSEAIFLTQGFAYDSAEQAEARFLGAGPDEYIYARYGNPTVAMFEERIALFEGRHAGCLCNGLRHGGGERRAVLHAQGG